MKLLMALCWCAIMGAAPALAEKRLGVFDGPVIENSVACELYQAATKLKRYNIDATRMFAKLDVTGTETRSTEGSFGLTIPIPFVPIKIGGSHGRTNKNGRGFGYHGQRNINVGNRPNCDKRNIVELGFADCIIRSQFRNGDSVDCSEEVTATSETAADFKATVWILDVCPSGKYSVTRNITVKITAPPPKDK
jgi:hypothetical protein